MSRKEEKESGAIEPRHRSLLSKSEGMPTFSPFSMMRKMAENMDRMFEGVGLPLFGRFNLRELEAFAPQVDIFKQDGKLIVRADVPGVELKDVSVDISDDAIVIEGERTYEHKEDEKGVYRLERGYGRFRREIPLPEGVKTDTATAKFKNGVLEIAMEAPPETENRRRVEIKSEEQTPKAQMSGQGETKTKTTTKSEKPDPKAA
jgi:HSP20 family protein